MEIITVTEENIKQEHICCAIANNNDCQVISKKEWLKKRFKEGLVFKKGDVRGKCLIEYVPAENAWNPIEAPDYMYIDCFWVAGQYKGQGNANLLLQECIKDSKQKGKKGLVVLSSPKKKPFLSDPDYLRYKGFLVADQAEPFFTLMYLPFEKDIVIPKFKEQVHHPQIEDQGYVLYYTNQCPFTAKYVPILSEVAKEYQIPFKVIHIQSTEQAQNAPSPVTTFCLFKDGQFVTNEILSPAKLEKMFQQNQ